MGCDCFKSKKNNCSIITNYNNIIINNINNQNKDSNLFDNISNSLLTYRRDSNLDIYNKIDSNYCNKNLSHKDCVCENSLYCICKYIPPKDNINKYNKASIQDFDIIRLIGEGTYGKVYCAKYKLTKEYFAIKTIRKKQKIKKKKLESIEEKNKLKYLRNIYIERIIMEQINSPFILKLEFSFQDKRKLYLVSELAQAGDLYTHLVREKFFSEFKAKFYLCELILAIECIHSYNLVYRDIKPENILLFSDGHIKLADFGLSTMILDENLSFNENSNNSCKENEINKKRSICGSHDYLAPEIYDGNYGKEVDWWSLGIVYYQMLTGYVPFKDKILNFNIISKQSKIELIKSQLQLEKPPLITDAAYEFIKKLLEIDPNKRLGSNNIKKCNYLKDINFNDVYNKQVTPPYFPYLSNKEDLSYFDLKRDSSEKSTNNIIDIQNLKNNINDSLNSSYNSIENYSFVNERYKND